jgi:hypothetical protein
MRLIGIDVSGLVSRSYYNGGGDSDINDLKTNNCKWHSVHTSLRTNRV